MNNLQDNKKKLREEFRRRRDAFFDQLDAPTRNLAFRRPASPLARLIEECSVIALYRAVGSEAPTMRLMEYLADLNKITAFPVVMGKEPLEFRALSHIDMLETGYQNIPEPGDNCPKVTPDLIIAPLVAFDRSLNRLGQGQGHYDRTFEKYPDAFRVGLSWSVQEADSIMVEDHDVPLHMIITECEIIQRDKLTS